MIISEKGKLVTANKKILKRITRSHILKIAQEHIEIEERDLNLDELSRAQEAFITGTSKGVLPIVQIGEELIGDGKPGEMTKRLGRLFMEFSANG